MATGSRRAQRTAPSRGVDDTRTGRRRWQPWVVAAGLALLCMLAYANSFDAGFVLDSRQLILRDTRVQAATAENLQRIVSRSYWWPYGESGLYRPLTTASYLLNYAVLGHGDRPAGYHAVNLLLHIANVLLLWRLVRRLSMGEAAAAGAAALWAVLPVSSEAVTNIVGRADLMAAATSLGALLVYARWRDTEAGTGARGIPATAVLSAATIALLVTIGALAKESAVAVLGGVVAMEAVWWQHGASLRRLALLGACCVAPLGAWIWQRETVLAASAAAEFPFTDNPIVGASFWQGRLTAVQVTWRYLLLLLWPAHLSNDYSYPQIPLATGSVADWVGVVLLAGGAAAALWQARANRAVLFFASLAFITFLPVSNLLFATGTIMGERLVYLPSAGLAALAAAVLAPLGTTVTRRRVLGATLVVIVAAYGARTVARNRDWKDDLTLWRSAVIATPASAKAHRALAEALYDADPSRGNLDAVMASADRAVALLEQLPDEQNTFQAFRQAGAYHLDKAAQIEARGTPGDRAELTRIYSRASHLLDRAVVIARYGAQRLPGGSVEPEADAQRLRAVAILGLDNPGRALDAARRSRLLSPVHPLGYRLSAQALLRLHRDEEAVMTLLTGSIVSGDRELGHDAMQLYADGVDPDGCAVVGSGTSAALNPQCPTVVRHSCIASAAAYQIFTKAGDEARAAQVKSAAIGSFACPADLMDRTNALVP